MRVLANLEYLSLFLGCLLGCCTWFSCCVANVGLSIRVTSQAIGFPLANGNRVVPSGRLLSFCIRLIGSLTAGIWARLIALHSPQDVIQMTVTLLSGSASAAGLSMQPTCIHCLTTHTSVWFTGFRAQPVGHCYPDGLV